MKSAFITGISGQDGSYLAELLLKNGYEVHGSVRPETAADPAKLWRIAHILKDIHLHAVSLADDAGLRAVLAAVGAAEIYHLASKTEVQFSATDTASVNEELAALRLFIEASPGSRLFYASSAKIFGIPDSSPQDEATPVRPVSPYGKGKAEGMAVVRAAREARGIFACSGIFFNHESPRRDEVFLPRKITQGAAKIKRGLASELRLGNIDAVRDWGFAGDYAEAMWLMLQAAHADDYVIGTGEAHSVRQLLDIAFGALDLDWNEYVKIDPAFVGPAEKVDIVANPAKANRVLKWQPRVSFNDLVLMMVRADLAALDE